MGYPAVGGHREVVGGEDLGKKAGLIIRTATHAKAGGAEVEAGGVETGVGCRVTHALAQHADEFAAAFFATGVIAGAGCGPADDFSGLITEGRACLRRAMNAGLTDAPPGLKS